MNLSYIFIPYTFIVTKSKDLSFYKNVLGSGILNGDFIQTPSVKAPFNLFSLYVLVINKSY